MSFGNLLLSVGLLAPLRQETVGATETGKGVSEGRLSSLPGIAEIYGCPYWISTGPLNAQECELLRILSLFSLRRIEISLKPEIKLFLCARKVP